MRKLINTNELKLNDIIVLVPRQFFCSADTKWECCSEIKCYKIDLLNCDIESFGECVEMGIVTSINVTTNKIIVRDIRSNQDYVLKNNIKFRPENEKEYTAWIF